MANLVDDVMTSIDNTSAGMVASIYNALGIEAFPFIRTMLIISMVLFGISMMLGWIEYPVRQFAKNSFKIITVLTLAFNWPFFNIIIYSLFTNSPDEIGSLILTAVGAGNTAGISSQIGQLLHNGIVASGMAFSSSGMFMPYILGALIFIAILVICGFALALLALSKIAMAVILALGPIFILFLLFDGTKQMFASWIQQILNFGFVSILTYIVMAFFLTLIDNTINLIPISPEIEDVVPLCVIGFIGTFVLLQVTGIASGLAGGVQVTTMGAMGAMGRQMQRFSATPALKQAGNLGSKGFQGARNAYDRIRNRNIAKRK